MAAIFCSKGWHEILCKQDPLLRPKPPTKTKGNQHRKTNHLKQQVQHFDPEQNR